MIRLQASANVLLSVFASMFMLMSGHSGAQLSEPVTQIAGGQYFACALTTSGGVKCWGENDHGQLGDNSNSDRPLPVDVKGAGGVGLLSGIAAIAVGGNMIVGSSHSCALTTSGGVKCWGGNQNGQLGNNSTSDSFTPVDVAGMSTGVVAISAGDSHTCALTAGGGVKCWGYNFAGQLGDSSTTQRSTPVDVFGLTSGVSAISAGAYETCALTTAGGMKCWGRNVFGQLGDGSVLQRNAPVDVSGLTSGVLAMAAGNQTTCAVTSAGGAKCWGDNLYGQIGDGTTTPRYTPVDVFGLASGVVAISNSAGSEHTCALMTSGGMKCWGRDDRGQVGDNAPSIGGTHTPADVVGLQVGIAAIAVQALSTCALSTTGKPRCWGDNSVGQVGDGTTTTPRLTPTRLSGSSASEIAMLALGESHTCVLTLAGGVKCWGFNTDGELGNASIAQSLVPVDVSGLASGVAFIAASKFHSCAVTTAGGAKCWGQNTSGSLGDGTQLEKHVPTDVFGLTSGIAAMTVGSNHTCALTTAGGAMCWGGNSLGVVGNGNYSQQLVPAPVQQQPGVVYAAISAGDTVTCALTLAGTLQCWGANNAGQLGDGTLLPVKTNVPQDVPGLAVISAMDAGGDHSCVLTAGSGLKCWGSNLEGELGDGTKISPRPSPNDVTGLTSGIAALSAGTVHTCAVTSTGGAKCWGNNFFAQLGDGSTTGRSLPVDVVGLATGVTGIEAGIGHTCALTIAGDVKCWGHNLNGQLGDNSTAPRLTPVSALVAGQSIAFTPPAQLAPGVPTVLSATAASGLAVAFDTWTPGTCSITGNSVTASAAGLCGLRAAQVGNGNIPPAPQILRLVPVVIPPASIPRLGNLSTRMQVLTGNDVMIGGFIIGGATPKSVVVRARGPSLIPFGITNALANPVLQLFSGQTVIASNDDWAGAANAAAITSSGFAPDNALESAILTTLSPGAYTAIVSGVGNTTGVGIVEVFEVDHPEIPLSNISTRGQVLTGNDVMIGGFVIQGDSPLTVVVRARGPSLIPFGITNALVNPVLQLFSGSTLVASNDDWGTATNAAALTASGFAPSNALESAILITLNPGAYTAIVTGSGGGTGVGIVEVFAQ